MFKVRVIPCLDVKDGRVVKGVRFLDLRDAGDPVEAAIAYAERHGIPYQLSEPKRAARRGISYSDNFAFKRSDPWTH